MSVILIAICKYLSFLQVATSVKLATNCNTTETIQSLNGSTLERVNDLILGAYIGSTKHDWETEEGVGYLKNMEI